MLKYDTLRIVKEPYIWPIGEEAFAAIGCAPGTAMVDAEIQATPQDPTAELEPLKLLQPLPTRTKEPQVKLVPVVSEQDVPVGAKLKVWWQDSNGDGAWYVGKVISIDAHEPTKTKWHEVEYEGYEEQSYNHNLAKEREQGTFPWYVVRERAKANAVVTKPPSAPARQSSRLTAVPPSPIESTQSPDPVVRLLDELIAKKKTVSFVDSTGWMQAEAADEKKARAAQQKDRPSHRQRPQQQPNGEPIRRSSRAVTVAQVMATAFENITPTPWAAQVMIDQLMADPPESSANDTVEDLLLRVSNVKLQQEAMLTEAAATADVAVTLKPKTIAKVAKHLNVEVNAVEKFKYIRVVTDEGGTQYIHEPKGLQEMLTSPERDAWLEISRTAWAALKATPGNRACRVDECEVGAPIFDCTTVCKVKTEADSGKLDKRSVRHNVDGKRGVRVLESLGIQDDTPTSSSVMDDVCGKMIISDAAARDRTLQKADVQKAYTNAETKRGKRYVRCPASCREYDEDGTEMVLELGPPLFGEPPAGREWQDTLHADLLAFGWQPFENVPSMYRFVGEHSDAILGTIVDDLLISESSGYAIGDATVAFLRAKYVGVTQEHKPTAFAGCAVERGTDYIKISQPHFIEKTMRELCPELLEDKAQRDFLEEHAAGRKLEELADGMVMEEPIYDSKGKIKRTAHGKLVQRYTGALRWHLKVSAGRLNVITHRLSCVQARAPPEALIVAKCGMIFAHRQRNRGIKYIKNKDSTIEGALSMGWQRTEGVHAIGDASWGDRNLIGLLVMMNGGAIICDTKKAALADCSAEVEGVATSKLSEYVEHVNEVRRGMGILPAEPVIIGTDNLSTMRVANNIKSATRLKHALRRFGVLQQRVAAGSVKLEHVPDKDNMADFLTKWTPRAKYERSVRYASGEAAHGAK